MFYFDFSEKWNIQTSQLKTGSVLVDEELVEGIAKLSVKDPDLDESFRKFHIISVKWKIKIGGKSRGAT
jgi:hypothetical protein